MGVLVPRPTVTAGRRVLALLLLLTFFARGLTNLRDQSPIVDEPIHLTRAVAYWQNGDLRLQLGHPPLMHALSGALLMTEPDLPSVNQLPGWEKRDRVLVAEHFLGAITPSLERVLWLGRFPVLLLSLLLLAFVYRWSYDLCGPVAALVSLALASFDPNLLAHATLITTDMGVTVGAFVALYVFDRWLKRPTFDRATLAGFALGLALAAKLSALILLPLFALFIAAKIWSVYRSKARAGSFAWGLVLIAGLTFLVLWGIYRFDTGPWRGFPFEGSLPLSIHWDNLRRLRQHDAAGHATFLLGELSTQGWWYYFPLLLLIKTPLSLLILVGVATVLALARRLSSMPWRLLLFPIAYLAISLSTSINIGYRHLLPVLPPLILWGAAAVPYWLRRGRWGQCLLTAIGLWSLVSMLAIHPHYLSYFNELVGGPDNGYRYAVDSNLDWGQDLERLADYWHALPDSERPRFLAYFGTAKPAQYGLTATSLLNQENGAAFHPFNPSPGIYAISASLLQGLGLPDPDRFDWFRHRSPTDRVGHSIFIYRVKRPVVRATWVAQCFAPAAPLTLPGLTEATGRSDLRTIYFDCRTSWVYPSDEAPGWYIVPDTSEGATLVPDFLTDSQISFKGRPVRGRPGLTVYWMEEGAPPANPSNAPTQPAIPSHTCFEDTACFLAYQVEPGNPLRVYTVWQLLAPQSDSLSIMAHLLDAEGLDPNVAEGETLAVGDGLGYPAEQWQPGDILIQGHDFALPRDVRTVSLRIGWYYLNTLARISPDQGPHDYVLLGPLQLANP